MSLFRNALRRLLVVPLSVLLVAATPLLLVWLVLSAVLLVFVLAVCWLWERWKNVHLFEPAIFDT